MGYLVKSIEKNLITINLNINEIKEYNNQCG